jgi:Protein of unknown function (DUF2474)
MHEETFEKRCRMAWLADARATCRCRVAAVDARNLALRPATDTRKMWLRRVGWLVLIWAASVSAMGLAAWL